MISCIYGLVDVAVVGQYQGLQGIVCFFLAQSGGILGCTGLIIV